jgi:hypothetical protein
MVRPSLIGSMVAGADQNTKRKDRLSRRSDPMNPKLIAALGAALLLPASLDAQTQGPGQPAAKTKAKASSPATPATPQAAEALAGQAALDQVSVPVRPQTATPLPEAQPVPTAFSLGPIEGVNPSLIAGVTAKGYARKVTVGQKPVGQVLVTIVAKGEREEAISTEGLSAQFDAKDDRGLWPEKTLEVTGSKTALVAALERLAKVEKTEETKKTPSEPGAQTQASSGKSGNDLAAQYRSPSVTSTPVETPDPTVEVRTSTEGCAMRIDFTQGRAIRQSKEQTYEDGVLSKDGQCSDSEVSFPLQKSYAACTSDIVDLAARKAWAQYQLQYTDAAGETRRIGECTRDEVAAAIVEDETACPVQVDYTARQVVPQSVLTYVNRGGLPVQVRSCAPSTLSAPIALVESAAACPMRHDFAAGLSHELTMWTYQRAGLAYQAAPCTDSGRTFAHELVYTDAAGAQICPPITDLAGRTVTLQSRRRIVVDGTPVWVTECTPDTTTQAVLSPTDGCLDPTLWVHDIEAGQSYGQERFYYMRGTQREYVSTCRTSGVLYRHDQTLTGWQTHDDQLWAYPLNQVTITVAGKPYVIAASEVLPGATQMPYVLDSTADQPTGASTYDGCTAWRQTGRVETWVRPDGSHVQKPVGVGSPQGPLDVCVTSVIETRSMVLSDSAFDAFGGGGSDYYYGRCSTTNFGSIDKTQTRNIETGQTLASTCRLTSTWSVSTGCHFPGSYTPVPVGGATYIASVPPCPF